MCYPIWFIGLILLLDGCNAQPDHTQAVQNNGALSSPGIDSLETLQDEPLPKQATAPADSIDFETAFGTFFNALQAQDTVALNAFIDPQQGFWLIEQPGAMPAYTHFNNIQEVKRSYQEKPFTSLSKEIKVCQLQQQERFPDFDCALMDNGATGYTSDGCFYTSDSAFRKNDMWQYASLSRQQEQQVQTLQQQVQVSVLHTQTSFRFHFGYHGGQWHLYFADLRVPCSA